MGNSFTKSHSCLSISTFIPSRLLLLRQERQSPMFCYMPDVSDDILFLTFFNEVRYQVIKRFAWLFYQRELLPCCRGDGDTFVCPGFGHIAHIAYPGR